MAQTPKVIGQAAPGATTETDLYTVPSSTTAVISSLVICNRASSDATFRISASVAGAATANKDYLFYDVTVSANDTIMASVGLTLAATDKLRVYASNANLSFSAFGVENT